MFAVESRVQRPRRIGKVKLGLVLLVLIGFFVSSFTLPLAPVKATPETITRIEPRPATLAWPAAKQSAIGVPGYGVLASNGSVDKPLPIASVSKVLTALAVLKQYPLLKGQQGPTITITEEDVANYKRIVGLNGSAVPVEVGEQITQYQALQALMLPSANNMADLLANWAFGSEAQYVAFANTFVKSLGMSHTTVADASGYSPQTMSTAPDLVLLGTNAMDNPVLAEIVGQTQATIPVAGAIQNGNALLGRDEIVGIKTGYTEEAGGCFMVASRHALDKDHHVVVVAVTMGATDRAAALNATIPLLQSSYPNFSVETVVKAGQKVGTYTTSWGQTVEVTAKQSISGLVWKPDPPSPEVLLSPVELADGKPSIPHGEVTANFGRTKISSPVEGAAITKPSLLWRIKHPFQR